MLLSSTVLPGTLASVIVIGLDRNLSWQSNIKHIKLKLAIKTKVFTNLIAPTWDASLQVSRPLYTTLVCPAITTSFLTWLAAPEIISFHKRVGEELQRVDKWCLRTIARAYKATLILSLQAEVVVFPLPLYINGIQAYSCPRSAKSGIEKVIGEEIIKVRHFLSCIKTRARQCKTR